MLNSHFCDDNREFENNSENKKVKYNSNDLLPVHNLSTIVESIQSENINTQVNGAIALRKLLCVKNNPPIDEILQSGILPSLIKLLSLDTQPLLQSESLWSLCNIASGNGNHTKAIVNTGVIPTLIKLLQSPCGDVIKGSLWTLANIAADSVKFRDIVLNAGVIQIILDTFEKQSNNNKVLRNVARVMVNLFRGEPSPAKELVFPALPILARLLETSNEKEIIIDVSWALSYYSNSTNDRIQDIINSGVCKRLVELLFDSDTSVIIPVLGTIGNIVAGDNKQTEFIMNISVLPCLLHLLSSEHKGVKREACWTISNICGGNREFVQSVIDANIIPKIISIIANENESNKVKEEALWIINNVFSCGNENQIGYIIGLECMTPIINLLDNCKKIKILHIVFATIKSLLQPVFYNRNINPSIECIESCDGFEKVKLYSNHYRIDIANNAIEILNCKNLIQDIINSGVCKRLVELLFDSNPSVTNLALKIIANIVAGDDKHIEFIMNISVLPCLLHLLSSEHKGVKREACWTISNICGGNRESIQSVIDADIVPKVISIIANENESSWVKECH
ncbi:hypothetical protein ABK040_005696 [Willaertia magna]